jgi:hypothetical protein
MHLHDQIKRIERIDYLIRSRSTGCPAELASKLHISPSQLYETVRIMKEEFDAPIYYSRADQSYCYEENVEFICAFREVENSV